MKKMVKKVTFRTLNGRAMQARVLESCIANSVGCRVEDVKDSEYSFVVGDFLLLLHEMADKLNENSTELAVEARQRIESAFLASRCRSGINHDLYEDLISDLFDNMCVVTKEYTLKKKS